MKKLIFKGCGVAIVTPMHEDGSVNFEEYGKLIDFQVENGCDAIITCGTTGESATLSIEEHCEVIEYAIKKTAGRIPVIAGTGSNCTATAIELSQHAEKAGADALLLVTPYYNKCSQAGFIKHFTTVADATNLPVILYNVPSRTGCNILPETYYELSKHPRIVATKEANSDFTAIAKTMSLCGDDLIFYSGNDDQALPMMALGGKGVISVVSNVCPDVMRDLTKRFFAGDLKGAQELNIKYNELMRVMFIDVNPIPVKEAMNMMGFHCGPCRLPLTPLSEKAHAQLADAMKKYGLA